MVVPVQWWFGRVGQKCGVGGSGTRYCPLVIGLSIYPHSTQFIFLCLFGPLPPHSLRQCVLVFPSSFFLFYPASSSVLNSPIDFISIFAPLVKTQQLVVLIPFPFLSHRCRSTHLDDPYSILMRMRGTALVWTLLHLPLWDVSWNCVCK